MKKSSFICAAFVMAFSVLTAFAADITGEWSGQMAGPNGEGFQLAFTFKQAGTKLTGTVKGPQGEPVEIGDGKVEGDKVSFTVSAHDMLIKHEGDIKGDEIKLSAKSDQGEFPGGPITLKRNK